MLSAHRVRWKAPGSCLPPGHLRGKEPGKQCGVCKVTDSGALYMVTWTPGAPGDNQVSEHLNFSVFGYKQNQFNPVYHSEAW